MSKRTKEPTMQVLNAAGEDGRPAEIRLYGEIGPWGISADAFARALDDVTASDLNVRINSPGGSIFDGVAIYSQLRSHAARVVVTVDSLAASAASFIAMAGDEIRMEPAALMMIHEGRGGATGTATDLREWASLLDKLNANITAIYARRSKRDADEIAAWMGRDRWFTAAEALDVGLADRINEDDEPDAGSSDPAAAMRMVDAVMRHDRTSVSADTLKQLIQPLAVAGGIPAPNPEQSMPIDLDAFKAAATEHPEWVEAVAEDKITAARDEAAAEAAPKPATLAELKAAFPDAGADFRETQLEASATLADAREAHTAAIAAELKQLRDDNEQLRADLAKRDPGTAGTDPVDLSDDAADTQVSDARRSELRAAAGLPPIK